MICLIGCKRAWKRFFDVQFGEKVEASLLAPYAALPLKMKARTNLGQLFHVGAAVGTRVFGVRWPQHVALFDALDEGRAGRLALHTRASILCGIVHTDWHWACFFYRRGDDRAWISDGLRQPQIKDAVTSAMLHISETPWFQKHSPPSQPAAEFMLVPNQPDEWSCGHRVLQSFLFVLEHFQKHQEIPDAIPPDSLSDEAVKN